VSVSDGTDALWGAPAITMAVAGATSDVSVYREEVAQATERACGDLVALGVDWNDSTEVAAVGRGTPGSLETVASSAARQRPIMTAPTTDRDLTAIEGEFLRQVHVAKRMRLARLAGLLPVPRWTRSRSVYCGSRGAPRSGRGVAVNAAARAALGRATLP